MAERITLQTNPITEHAPLDVAGCVALVKKRMPNGWYDEGELTIIFERINYWCAYFEISPRTVASQILHETGWFRFGGDVYWWQFNFAGLGSTGGVLGHSFTIIKPEERQNTPKLPPPTARSRDYSSLYLVEHVIDIPVSIDYGVLAVVVHHLVYTRGPMSNWLPEWTQYRWNDPRYQNVIDAGLAGSVKTIEGYGGKWAFPGVGYGQKIVDIANLLPVKEDVMARPKPFKLSFPLTVDHIPWNNPNRSRLISLPTGRGWITIHETGNTNVGADARMHRTFLHNGGGKDNVSFNYMVDDDDAYECVPRGERTWQASDSAGGPGNSSVSIELCVNQDGDWQAAKDRLIELVVWLIATDENLSVNRIAQHNTWAPDRKNCPSKLRANNNREWNILIARIKELAAEKAQDAPPPVPAPDPNALYINDFWIVNEIYHEWKSLGPKTLPVYGYPISHMDRFLISGVGRDAQIFERAVLAVYEEDTPDGVQVGHPFRVRVLTLQEQDAVVADAIERGIIQPFD